MIYIHHHLGLGDHIICNGLVREIYKKHDGVRLFCKYHNLPSVNFMYRDLDKFQTIGVAHDGEVHSGEHILRVGFSFVELYKNTLGLKWDESFYYQCVIDFNKRWDSFYFKRDFVAESKLVEKLNPSREPFALIHKSGSDGIDRVDEGLIEKSLKKIFVKKGDTDNIFNYLSLIESASEIHCIDSYFKHLVDSFELKKPLYYHNKEQRSPLAHSMKNAWIEV